VRNISKAKFIEGYEKGLICDVISIPEGTVVRVYGRRVVTEDLPAEIVFCVV